MAPGVDLTDWMFAGNRSKDTGCNIQRGIGQPFSELYITQHITLADRKPILLTHFYEDSSFLFLDIPQKGNEANLTFGAEI